jgi:hypothetical protein
MAYTVDYDRSQPALVKQHCRYGAGEATSHHYHVTIDINLALLPNRGILNHHAEFRGALS